jgi:hypothetical protein
MHRTNPNISQSVFIVNDDVIQPFDAHACVYTLASPNLDFGQFTEGTQQDQRLISNRLELSKLLRLLYFPGNWPKSSQRRRIIDMAQVMFILDCNILYLANLTTLWTLR